MHSIKDDRRFIKLLDHEYHKTQPGYQGAVDRWKNSSGSLTLRMHSAGGAQRIICIYTDFGEQVLIKPGSLLYTWADLREILSCFEDTSAISDEEWTFFCVVMPDQRQKLGRTTETFSGIELFLSGRGTFTLGD